MKRDYEECVKGICAGISTAWYLQKYTGKEGKGQDGKGFDGTALFSVEKTISILQRATEDFTTPS